MTDDPVASAASKAKLRRAAITTTATLLHRRLDPRLIAADLAKVALTRSIARVAAIKTTPKQRKRALISAGIAAATAIGMRVLYRNAREKPSPPPEDDVKRLT
jgi:hypothetical protein